MHTVESTFSTTLDAIVEEGIEAGLYPGASLVVGSPGGVLHSKGYGTLTWEADSPPVRPDTLYDLASVSKVVATATAAWLLMEEGRLHPDDRVSKYVPAFAANGKGEVTVRDLMTHVSGLKAYEDPARVEAGRLPGETRAAALIRHHATLPRAYETREDYAYSCLNFQTLAHIVELIIGGRMEDLLRERVYAPLGMHDTTFLPSESQWRRAAPAGRGEAGMPLREVHDPLARYHGSAISCPGNAGLFSTAADLARYCDMILRGGILGDRRVLRSETVREATRRQTPANIPTARGLGFDLFEAAPFITPINREDGSRVVGHLGYTGTMIWIDMESRVYMVFLTNRTLSRNGRADAEPPAIDSIRGRLCDVILRSRPEYHLWFHEADAVAGGG